MKKQLRDSLAAKEVDSSTFYACGCGAIPIPLVDVGATIAVQMRMINNLCDIYELERDDHVVKGLIGSVAGNIGKRTLASMLKTIPIIGTSIGSFANAALSGASTYALGHAFIKYVAMDKTLKTVGDIDISTMTNIYQKMSKQASDFVASIKVKGGANSEMSEQPEKGVFEEGVIAFGTSEKFQAWLGTPNVVIGGKRPFDLFSSANKEDETTLRNLIRLHGSSEVK